MDWPRFGLCFIWILYVTKLHAQSITTPRESKDSCIVGQPIPKPDVCNSCICFEGRISCTHLNCSSHISFEDRGSDCVEGDKIPPPPPPDECNVCTCIKGQIACSNFFCIPKPNCTEDQKYPPFDDCNVCVCRQGYVVCTNRNCHEEKSKNTKQPECVDGQSIPSHSKCVHCTCEQGKKKCKNICSRKYESRRQHRNGRSSHDDKPEKLHVIPIEHKKAERLGHPELNSFKLLDERLQQTEAKTDQDLQPTPQEIQEMQLERQQQQQEMQTTTTTSTVPPEDLGTTEEEASTPKVEVRLKAEPHTQQEKPEDEQQETELPDYELSTQSDQQQESREVSTKQQEQDTVSTKQQEQDTAVESRFKQGEPETQSQELERSNECQDGEFIPSPAPPNDCNRCFCKNTRIICTVKSCTPDGSDIDESVLEEMERNILNSFDKKISMDPFIEMIYQKSSKTPTKLVHKHTFNGYRQEVKVNSDHIPKDTVDILSTLATSLDNPTLVAIGDKLLSSLESFPNQDSTETSLTKPFSDWSETHSGKLSTSGSQSNETILVFPDNKNSQPITDHHKTSWSTYSSSPHKIHKNMNKSKSHNYKDRLFENIYEDNPCILPSLTSSRNAKCIFMSSCPLNPSKSNCGKLKIPQKQHKDDRFLDTNKHKRPKGIKQKSPQSHQDETSQEQPESEELNYLTYPEESTFRPNSDRTPSRLTGGLHEPPKSPQSNASQEQPGPGVLDDLRFPDQSNYKPNPDETPSHPKGSLNKYPQSHQDDNSQEQLGPEVLDDLRFPDQSNYKPNPDETPLRPKGTLHENSQTHQDDTSQEQPELDVLGDLEYPDQTNYKPNSDGTPVGPKDSLENISHSHQDDTSQEQPKPEVLDDLRFPDQSNYKPNPVGIPSRPKGSLQKLPQSQYPLPQKQRVPGFGDDPNKEPNHPKYTLYKPNHLPSTNPPSENTQTRPPTKKIKQSIFDNRGYKPLKHTIKRPYGVLGDPNEFKHKPDLGETPVGPKGSQEKNPQPHQDGTIQEQPKQEVLDDLRFPDQSNHIPNLDGTPSSPKGGLQKPSKLPKNKISHKQPLPGVENEYGHGHPDETKYKPNSGTYPSRPKGGKHKPKSPQNTDSQELPIPGIKDDLGYPDETKYKPNSGAYPSRPKGGKHKPKSPQNTDSQEQLILGVKDDLGYPDETKYKLISGAYHSRPKGGKHKPKSSQKIDSQEQLLPGVDNEYRYPDETKYKPNLGTYPSRQKGGKHKPKSPQNTDSQEQPIPGVKYDLGYPDETKYKPNTGTYHSRPKGGKHKHKSPHNTDSQEQPIPGVLDDPDESKYKLDSGGNPSRPKGHLHKHPKFPQKKSQNQPKTELLDDLRYPDEANYNLNSEGTPLRPKDSLLKPPQSQHLLLQKQRVPGTFHDYSNKDPRHPGYVLYQPDHLQSTTLPNENLQARPPTKNHKQGIFDNRGYKTIKHTTKKPNGVLDNPRYSDEPNYKPNGIPSHPKGMHKFPQSHQHDPNHEQPAPGVLDDIGYPDDSDTDGTSSRLKDDNDTSQEQPEVLDDFRFPDQLDYTTNSDGTPSRPKGSLQKPSHTEYSMPHKQRDPTRPKYVLYKPNHFQPKSTTTTTTTTKSPDVNTQPRPLSIKKHKQGIFDNRGYKPLKHKTKKPYGVLNDPRYSDDLKHKPNSDGSPSRPKGDNSQEEPEPGVLDDLRFPDQSNYTPNPDGTPSRPEGYLQKIPQSHENDNSQEEPQPEVLDDLRFPDQSNSKPIPEGTPSNPKGSLQKHPQSHQNEQPEPAVLDDLRYPDEPDYKTNTDQNPLRPKYGLDEPSKSPQNNTSQEEPEPELLDDLTYPDESNYKSNSYETPLRPTGGLQKPPYSQHLLPQMEHAPGGVDDNPNKDLTIPNTLHTTKSPDENGQTRYPTKKHKPAIFDSRGYKTKHTTINPHRPLQSKNTMITPLYEPGKLSDNISPDGYKPNTAEDPTRPSLNQNKFGTPMPEYQAPGVDTLYNSKSEDQPENQYKPPPPHNFSNRSPEEMKSDEQYEKSSTTNPWFDVPFQDISTSSTDFDFNPNHPQNESDQSTSTYGDRFSEPKSTLSSPEKEALTETPETDETFPDLTTESDENTYNRTSKVIDEPRFTNPTTTEYSDTTNVCEVHNMNIPKVPQNRCKAPKVENKDDDDADSAEEEEIILERRDVFTLTPELSETSLLFPKMYSRLKYRVKDKKEECSEGTEWISNCHGCSCYEGHAICIAIPNCNLRPFGEPMKCKPYSVFKMGDCYSCECNGDGIPECDATDCKEHPDITEQNKGLNNSEPAPEFWDEKKTKELIEYYNTFKKIPKECTSKPEYPICAPGTSWVSSCHQCECNEHSYHECTPIEDCELDFKSYGKPGRCKPNTKFYPKKAGCVECTCDDEGNPHCPSSDSKS